MLRTLLTHTFHAKFKRPEICAFNAETPAQRSSSEQIATSLGRADEFSYARQELPQNFESPSVNVTPKRRHLVAGEVQTGRAIRQLALGNIDQKNRDYETDENEQMLLTRLSSLSKINRSVV